jgi:hypothetical protein
MEISTKIQMRVMTIPTMAPTLSDGESMVPTLSDGEHRVHCVHVHPLQALGQQPWQLPVPHE